jgi:hypothetical protein
MGRNLGTRQLNRLTARFISNQQKPSLFCDGGGLYLQVSRSLTKAWIFRYRSPTSGKLRDMGPGALQSACLAEAAEPQRCSVGSFIAD